MKDHTIVGVAGMYNSSFIVKQYKVYYSDYEEFRQLPTVAQGDITKREFEEYKKE